MVDVGTLGLSGCNGSESSCNNEDIALTKSSEGALTKDISPADKLVSLDDPSMSFVLAITEQSKIHCDVMIDENILTINLAQWCGPIPSGELSCIFSYETYASWSTNLTGEEENGLNPGHGVNAILSSSCVKSNRSVLPSRGRKGAMARESSKGILEFVKDDKTGGTYPLAHKKSLCSEYGRGKYRWGNGYAR